MHSRVPTPKETRKRVKEAFDSRLELLYNRAVEGGRGWGGVIKLEGWARQGCMTQKSWVLTTKATDPHTQAPVTDELVPENRPLNNYTEPYRV